MDADAELEGFAAHLYNDPAAMAPPRGTPKRKERSAQSKKTTKSSRSSLADGLERANIREGSVGNDEVGNDEVFTAHTGSSGDSGTNSGAIEGADFPAEYNIIRTAKNSKLAPTRMGGLFGLSRIASGAKMGFGEGGLAAGRDGRTYLAQNYHCTEMGLNSSFSVKKPSVSGEDDLACLACPGAHTHGGRMGDGKPVVIVLADQSFPAVVPAADGGGCLLIVRVEDGLLGELESVFFDRFRAFLKPHGCLPPGSVILIGSISHLRACGLQDYADALVKSFVSVAARVGAGVDVVPLVPVPLHGLETGSLVRSLMDLDSWILSVQGGGRTVLPKTRETFWAAVTSGIRAPAAAMDSQTLMMPTGFRNHRKHPMVSDPYDGHIPSSIPPVSEDVEKRILRALLAELNDVYGLKLDEDPDTSRIVSHNTGNSQTKVILVGGSHMARLAEALQQGGSETKYLGAPGWVATQDGLADAARKLTNLRPGPEDIVVLDIWSNSSFMGTDEFGLPCRAAKGNNDTRYHIVGNLQAAPKSLFEKILQDAVPVIESAGDSKIVMALPIPRYVLSKCCTSPNHISNFGKENFLNEMYRAAELAEQAIAGCPAASNVGTLGIQEVFNGADLDLHEVRTSGGEPIWSDIDPVHLTRAAYVEMAESVSGANDAPDARPRKRPRLESVVPAYRGGARGRQGRIRPPSWVSGMVSRATSNAGRGRGRGRGRGSGGLIGGPPRGYWQTRGRGFYRGRGRGFRGFYNN
jgi:hypothetical protein